MILTPPPSYAAYIWKRGKFLHLEFPGEHRAHSVQIPINEKGLALVIQLLSEREHAGRPTKIGTPGAPITAQILEALRIKHAIDEEADAALKDLGL